jgi:pilus assembly protein CpaF
MSNTFESNFSPQPFGRRGMAPSAHQPSSRAPGQTPASTAVSKIVSACSEAQARQQPDASRQSLALPRRRRTDGSIAANVDRARVIAAAIKLHTAVLEKLDSLVAGKLQRPDLAKQLEPIVDEILTEYTIQMNQIERRDLITMLLNEMIGLGPIEPLMSDESVTDILVNGAESVYVERAGRLELTDIKFRNNVHVMDMAMRIASRMGRRIDETTPYVDARLADGSRVNIIAPPLALRGPTISIRKFSRKAITLDLMVQQGNLSPAMATLLAVAARSRLNILISGGTGAGKTTLLNALSELIDPAERIITIEDAAELQLQQPHVVPLETRMVSLEGKGEVTIRDLVRNSLRMRPDRIILGEIRGAEALDMLQAMNTGHDGSLCTIHANKPRDALTRLEHMVGISGLSLPVKVLRAQIASAVNLLVQVARMQDGVRRITNISELIGQEGDVITMQELFTFEFEEMSDGKIKGQFVGTGFRPRFLSRAQHYGLGQVLLDCTAKPAS